jgi:hypothetical protein
MLNASMREHNDLSRLIREAAWLGGCFGAALGVTYLVEDKGNQLPFLTISLYGVSVLIRFMVWLVRRSP